MYDIRITFETCHEGSLKDGSLIVVPFLTLAVTGILTSEHLRTFAVVGVITETMG